MAVLFWNVALSEALSPLERAELCQHQRERGEELAARQMLREHLAYGLSQCVGALASLVFLVLVGAADDLHGPASSGSSMSSSSTSFLICWRSRSSCASNSS